MNNLYIMNLAIADFIIGLVKGTNNHMTIIQHHVIEIHLVKMITWYRQVISKSRYLSKKILEKLGQKENP